MRVTKNMVGQRTSRKLRTSELAMDLMMERIGRRLADDLRLAARQSFKENSNLQRMPFSHYNRKTKILQVGIRAQGSSQGRPVSEYIDAIQDPARGTVGRAGQPPSGRTQPPSSDLVGVGPDGRLIASAPVHRIAEWVRRNLSGVRNPMAYAITMARQYQQIGFPRRPWVTRVFNLRKRGSNVSILQLLKASSVKKIETIIRQTERSIRGNK